MDGSTSKEAMIDDRRIWIGNLDPRVTEFQLLKLLQKHGAIEKFDLIFHRNGPLVGQPRGYAFATYTKSDDAVIAKTTMNGLALGQRNITVTWAHGMNYDEGEKPKPDIVIPALAMSKEGKKSDRVTQIQAIEAKLKLMEKKKEDELKINDSVASKPPVIVQYQHNKTQTSNSNLVKYKQSFRRHDRHINKPYNKNSKRR